MADGLVGFASDDLGRFARDLEALQDEWGRELRSLHEAAAEDLQRDARSGAARYGGVRAKAAALIEVRAVGGGEHEASAVMSADGDVAGVGLWGADRRTGWNARNTGSRPQHPPWVGGSWEPGGPGGPYGVGDAFRAEAARLDGRYGDLVDALARRAGFH